MPNIFNVPISVGNWADRLEEKLFEITKGLHEQKNPFAVKVYRVGDIVFVSSSNFLKEIPMHDKWWWIFTGKTWQGKVRQAQLELFEKEYKLYRENEMKDYEVGRFQ